MHIDRYERQYLIAVAAVLGLFFAALVSSALVFGVRLPQPEGYINPLTLNRTVFANPGMRNMGNGVYDVYIVARMWAFDAGSDEKDERGQDVLRVPVGSTVNFYLTSADVTHGFIVERHNANIEVLPGHVGRSSTRFNEVGTFHIQCHEYCGRGHQNMYIKIIVEPADGSAA